MTRAHRPASFALHLILALPVVAAACARGDLVDGVSDSAFVTTMAELRRVQNDATLDSARRANARAKALQGRGLSPDQLEAAAKALAHEPARAVEIWRAIETKAAENPNPPMPKP